MIESKNDTSKNLEKALQALEQAKQRVANEKKKQNEKKRKAENHHKYIVGGIVVKYFPDCYRYDESELNRILSVARMLKASLPNEWSYELAEEVVRDYVQRNFVDKGMCEDWAIHDSENDKMRYDKEHKDSLSKYPELKERMRKLSATTERTLRGSFRTRADSTTGNRAD